MDTYRIITNGKKYKVQQKIFFFFWYFIRECAYGGCWPVEFSTLQEARDCVEHLKADDLRAATIKRKKWVTVE